MPTAPRRNAKIFSGGHRDHKKSKETMAKAVDGAADISEFGPLLNHVPIVSLAVTALNVRDNFAQARLKRNVAAFLKATEAADTATVQKLIEKFSVDGE